VQLSFVWRWQNLQLTAAPISIGNHFYTVHSHSSLNEIQYLIFHIHSSFNGNQCYTVHSHSTAIDNQFWTVHCLSSSSGDQCYTARIYSSPNDNQCLTVHMHSSSNGLVPCNMITVALEPVGDKSSPLLSVHKHFYALHFSKCIRFIHDLLHVNIYLHFYIYKCGPSFLHCLFDVVHPAITWTSLGMCSAWFPFLPSQWSFAGWHTPDMSEPVSWVSSMYCKKSFMSNSAQMFSFFSLSLLVIPLISLCC